MVAVPVLSGCAAAVIGGAAVGTLVALDRRTSGIQLEDEGIELRAGARLRDALGEPAHVNVTSYNRQVLLSGEVPTDQARQQAEQIAQRVENVRSVVNDLAVMPKSTLAQRSNDALITGKVKASLVDSKDLSAAAVKVVTERGVVYLMGRVTEREVKRATEIASRVSA
jgi:osmotically-inducible protein OsmY